MLDGAVIVLASWTIVYHVCLVLGLAVAWAVGGELAVLVALVLAWRASPTTDGPTTDGPTTDGPTSDDAAAVPDRDLARTTQPWVFVTVAAAVCTAVAMAASLLWTAVWVGWLTAAGAGIVAALRSSHGAATVADDARAARSPSNGRARWALATVGIWAVGLTVMSTFTLRPNPDDLYYVNLSQWVAEHGTFPTRDTIFSDLAFPMSNWPPVASYDPMVGAIAHVAGVAAGSIVYMVVTPIATLLAVLALWRLLRAWRVPNVPVALSAALIFLLFDGTSAYAPPGNLFLTRLWQGKVILLCVLVPLLLVYALRYVDRPSRGRAGWLFAGGVAAVGLSTTAMFLVPPIAAAGAAPLLRRAPRRAALGFAAMAAYPLGTGVITKAMGGRTADDFGLRRLYRFDPAWFGHQIFLTGLVALVAVGAVLAGALLVPNRAARITTGLLAIVLGLTFIPGLTQLSYDTIGLGPTLWRLSWAASIAALVGVLASWVAGRLRSKAQAMVAAAASVGLLIAFGPPIWVSDTNTAWHMPFHWQRNAASRLAAAEVIQHSRPGDIVLAPDDLAITLDVTTTQVKTVAPRDYFMDYLRDDPAFRYPQRITLVDFLNDGPWNRQVVSRALSEVGVATVCVYSEDVRRFRAVIAAGYAPFLSTSTFRCLAAASRFP